MNARKHMERQGNSWRRKEMKVNPRKHKEIKGNTRKHNERKETQGNKGKNECKKH